MDEKPMPQHTRPVNLLDAAPGRADAPGVGEKIAIITFEFDGEVEQPLMLRMRDVKRLTISLLAILAHHGDEKAKAVIESHFRHDEDEDDDDDDGGYTPEECDGADDDDSG